MVETRASRRKRKRSEDEQGSLPGTPASGLEFASGGKSYFDTISEEAVENIIRFSSNMPRHPNWRAFVPPKFALSLLKSETVLAKTSRNIFRSLELSSNREADPFWRKTHDSRLTVWKGKRRGIVQPIISELRATLFELNIDMKAFPTQLNRFCITFFPQVKRLALNSFEKPTSFRLGRMLSALGGKLEFLEIGASWLDPGDASAIAEFGKGLKGFKLSVTVMSDTNAMWKPIGETLEEVSLSWMAWGEDWDIRLIMHSCKRLRQVTLRHICSQHGGIEAICTSLGGQLTSLTLSWCDIDPSRLGRIAAACTNVSINLFEIGGCSVAALRELGPRACRVDIGEDTVEDLEHESPSLVRAADVCENLVGMSCRGAIPDASFGAFFNRPKPFLVDFEGKFGKRFNVGLAFEVLTNKVSTLKKFDFCGKLPSSPILERFVEANPWLTSVLVIDSRKKCFCCMKSSQGINEDLDADLNLGIAAKIFLRCQQLKVLSLFCRESYAAKAGDVRMNSDYEKACLHARHRNIAVTICAYPYL